MIAALQNELLRAALGYAAKGWPVFPVRGDKMPLVKWKDGATTDADTIRQWWAKWPLAMIGVPTGEKSGLSVLDIDRKNGVDGLENLREALGFNPFDLTPLVVETPSGGLHFYFSHNGNLKNSAGLLAAGIDVRGDGGYIVAPPSHPNPDDRSRTEYSWLEGGV